MAEGALDDRGARTPPGKSKGYFFDFGTDLPALRDYRSLQARVLADPRSGFLLADPALEEDGSGDGWREEVDEHLAEQLRDVGVYPDRDAALAEAREVAEALEDHLRRYYAKLYPNG